MQRSLFAATRLIVTHLSTRLLASEERGGFCCNHRQRFELLRAVGKYRVNRDCQVLLFEVQRGGDFFAPLLVRVDATSDARLETRSHAAQIGGGIMLCTKGHVLTVL